MTTGRFTHVFRFGETPAGAAIRVGETMRAIAATHTIVATTITNPNDAPLDLALSIVSWRQECDLDVLTPSNEIRLKTDRLALGPGASQIISLAVAAADPRRERAYYLNLSNSRDELLGALPMFVTPIDARPGLCASIEKKARDARLVIANAGCAHARLERLIGDGGGALNTAPYLLAGARIELPLPRRAKQLRVIARGADKARVECVAADTSARARAG